MCLVLYHFGGNCGRVRGGRPGEALCGWLCEVVVSFVRVYPRACGGTRDDATFDKTLRGLSPRVRGNPAPGDLQLARMGSIPARAGEPAQLLVCVLRGRVYPRACGGTGWRILAELGGLSPRVRGNPGMADQAEPAKVYPRACGGTFVPIVGTIGV